MFRNNGLSIVLLSLFVVCFAGQAIAGWRTYNDEQEQHGQARVGFTKYLRSGDFWEATGENWESEFLQMAAFVLFTSFLYQRGSAESKRVNVIEAIDVDPRDFHDYPDVPGPVRRGGWMLRLYEHSLGITFIVLFLLSIWIHAVGGVIVHNNDAEIHGRPAMTLAEYACSSVFWFESFQNWQSEFLSLAAMVIATIWLRERGSSESKPVFAPHLETGR